MTIKQGSTVDLQEFAPYMDFERFKSCPSALNHNTLAIATERFLLLTGVPQCPTHTRQASNEPSYSQEEAELALQTRLVLEYKDSSSAPSALHWIDENLLCVGFESGLLLCFDAGGKEVFQFRGSDARVQSFKVASEQGVAVLWILYEDCLLVAVSLEDALQNRFCDAIGFHLSDQSAVHDFSLSPCAFAARGEWDIDEPPCAPGQGLRLVVVGFQCALAVYEMDMKRVRKDCKRLHVNTNSSNSGSVSLTKTLFSLVSSLSGYGNTDSSSSSSSSHTQTQTRANKNGVDLSVWSRATRTLSLSAKHKFFDDKRRIIRVSMDPLQRLLACADTLGRVTLFDTQSVCVLRIWKGVRDAHLGWIVDRDNNNISATVDNQPQSLSLSSSQRDAPPAVDIYDERLVVFAPQLGLLSIYQMRNGPCVRVIAVGMNSRLVPMCSFAEHQSPNWFFNAIPVRCEENEKSLSVLSLHGEDGSTESDLALLVDMVEEEVMRSPTHTPSVQRRITGNSDEGNESKDTHAFFANRESEMGEDTHTATEDENARHTDVIHSIQEALRQAKKRRQQDAFYIEETRRLLRVFRLSHVAEANTHAHTPLAPHTPRVKNTLTQSEAKIYAMLQQSTPKLVLRLLALIERAELSGFPPENNQEKQVPNNSSAVPLCVGLSEKRFSIEFHEKINEILRDRIEQSERERDSETEEKERKETAVARDLLLTALRAELDARVNLLRAYEQLLKSHTQLAAERNMHATDQTPNSTNHNSALSDDPIALCRLNNHRAESLCWALRRTRKYAKRDTQTHAQTPTLTRTESMSAPRSPLPLSPTPSHAQLPSRLSITPTFRADSVVEIHSPVRSSMVSTNTPLSLTPTPAVFAHTKIEGKHTTLLQLSPPPAGLSLSVAHTPSHTLSPMPSLSLTHSPVRTNARKRFDPIDFSVQNQSHTPTMREKESHTGTHAHTQPLSGTDACIISFSLFRSLHAEMRDHDGEFSYTPKLNVLLSLCESHSVYAHAHTHYARSGCVSVCEETMSETICVTNLSSIDVYAHSLLNEDDKAVGNSWSVKETERKDSLPLSLSSRVALDFLAFFFQSLIGDLESFKRFTDALKYEGSLLSGPLGVKTLLPGFLTFLSQKSLRDVVYDVMARRVSTSPLLRWVRDQLLTFQDMVSSYNRFLRTKLKDCVCVDASSVDALRESDVNEDELDLFVFHSLTHIRKEYLSQRSAGEETVSSAIPSFDEYVRHLLRPVLLDCRRNSHLELVLGFAAVLLETLCGVHEQVERRTYGADHLTTTIASWEMLIRQLRVLLFLRSRVYTKDPLPSTLFTVKNLQEGNLSLHKILAMDTLEFALRAQPANEHEQRCREVYQKRRQTSSLPQPQGEDPVSASASAPSDALVAWGTVADKRWRDIFAVAIAEDAIFDNASVQQQSDSSMSIKTSSSEAIAAKKLGKRRRKPLLLFFPQHNQSVFLGCYRCLLLTARWLKKVDSIELLAVMCEHLCELPSEWRGPLSLEIYKHYLFPVLQRMLAMEEDTALSHTESERDEGAGADGEGESAREDEENSVKLRQQILAIMSDANLLKSLTLLGVEVLNYVLEVLPKEGSLFHGEDVLSLSSALPLNALLLEDALRDSLWLEKQRDSLSDETNVLSRTLSLTHVNAARGSVLSAEESLLQRESERERDRESETWPSVVDAHLLDMFASFYSPHFECEIPPLSSDRTTTTLAQHTPGSERDKRVISRSASRELVLFHVSVWHTLTLRFQCGLRGVKVSQLVGESPLRSIVSGTMYGERSDVTVEEIDEEWIRIRLNEDDNDEVHRLRGEFLARCFCRLVLIESMPQVLYDLGSSLWGFEMDLLRLLHVYALVESGDKDNEIEEILAKFDDVNKAVDLLLSIARQRLGHTLRQMECVPSYGALLAGMDAEALQWAKQSPASTTATSVINTASLSTSSHSNSNSNSGSRSPGVYAAKSSSSGNRSAGAVVLSDVSSTRRLLLYAQSVLLSVPFNEREDVIALDLSSRASRRLSLLMSFSRYRSWVERKTRCDALLSLCQALAPLSASAKRKDSERSRENSTSLSASTSPRTQSNSSAAGSLSVSSVVI